MIISYQYRHTTQVSVACTCFALFCLLPATVHASKIPPGYKLVWKEEFSGKIDTPPDSRVWNYDLGNNGWGNQEMQNYVKDTKHSRIVADAKATDGKVLQILVTREGKGRYTSARLQTHGKFKFQYGYIEARIRLPYGQGVWPAFWMLGDNVFEPDGHWPVCGEIDIMENIGKKEWWGKNESSLHGPGYSGGNSLHTDYSLKEGSYFKDSYHTFSMLWQKDSIVFYVDGNPFVKRTPANISGKEWVFNHPFFIILDLAIGGNFPGSPDKTTLFPQRMLVDYIRVYQKPDNASAKDKKGQVKAGLGPIEINGE